MTTIHLDAVIIGGGVSGLWTLDHLIRQGYAALLLEKNRLGHGQTVAAQGIIHGGLKYALQGVFTASAEGIREMPLLWRDCLAGRREPNLSETIIRASYCHLWRTRSLRALAGEFGARLSLRVKPRKIERTEWPRPLKHVNGDVYRLDEQVIDPVSMVSCLARRNSSNILKIDDENDLEWQTEGSGKQLRLRIRSATASSPLELHPARVVLTAGEGNAALRRTIGLAESAMQRRPLHMVMLRGDLPELHGHCIDAAMTPRLTITSAPDTKGRMVWQLGGQVAERGVDKEPEALIADARKELSEVLPGFNVTGAEWATYRVNRAEAATANRNRPNDAQVQQEGDVLTAWPTKLALAPKVAQYVAERMGQPSETAVAADTDPLDNWPRPETALPPWETQDSWILDS